MRLLYKTGPMESLRKWLYRPKRDDPSPLAQFFFADEALNIVAAELDSFDGRKDPERCSSLVNQLQHAQDRVLNITNQIMDQVLGDERVARGFRVKFPEEVLQENLGVQLWFGAECLAAGSSIMNREEESVAMRPLAKALTRSLETVRSLLREQCLRTKGLELPMQDDMLRESLRICDRLFAEFELCYVSAMVNVKTPHEFEAQQLICVLFSETLRSALQSGLLTQEQVDSYDPALMFAVPRLSIVSGLLLYSRPPLAIDGPPEEMSDMFRPFRSLLRKIRALLYTLDRRELRELRRLLATDGDVTCSTHNESTSEDQYPDIGEYVSKFYAKNSQCRSLYHSQNSTTSETTESEVQPDTEESEAISPEPPKLSLPEDRSRRTSRNESTDLSSLRNLSTNGLMTFDPAVINEASMSENRQMPDNDLVTSLNEQVTKIADRLSSIVNDSEIIDHTSGHSFSTNDVPTVVTDEVSFTQSDQLNLPSTSHGYLIPNAISQEPVVMASLSHNNSAIFNQEENNDEDCPFIVADNGLDSTIVSNNISIANEMLSSILHDNNENTDNNTDEVPDKVKFALGYDSDPDSPGDSGVSTENTSLDRSPDTENNKEHFMKQNRVLKNDTDNKTESVLENSFSEFRENGDVTVNINYVEHNALQKNEAGSSRDVDTSNIEERNKTLQDWGANTSEQEHRSIRGVITELNQEDTSRNLSQDVEVTSRRDVEDDRRQKKRKSGKTKKKRSKMWSPGMVLLDSRALQANNPLRLNLDNFIDDSNTSCTVAECADDEQIALALQAQELAHRQKARGKFQSSEDLVHRLFVCIAGVADQLQTNFAADLRHILKSVFAMNQSPDEKEKEIEKEAEVYEAPRIQNGGSFDSVYSAEEAYADSHSSASSHSDNAANANENRNEVEINNRQPSHNTTRRNSMNQPTPSSSERRKSVNIQSSVSTGDLSENRVESRVERAPEWVPDIAAPDCMRCAAHFTAFRRRHHCRNCGKVFCASCSSNSIPLPRYGQMKPVRVCEECFRGIAQSCTRSAR